MLKKKNGFTLVEIIVVLVILAILAAFTVPTMIGFVEEAKGKAYLAEAREIYAAAQAVATEYSGTTDIPDGNVSQPQHRNDSWGTGLGVSISSYEVQYRTNKNSTLGSTPQWQASRQMYRYIREDFPAISNVNLLPNPDTSNPVLIPEDKDAAWVVTVGGVDDAYGGVDDATRTGKVTKVVYLRDGYRVTIAGDHTSVEKLE